LSVHDAIVISSFARTLTGSFLGRLARFKATELGTHAVKETVRRSGVEPRNADVRRGQCQSAQRARREPQLQPLARAGRVPADPGDGTHRVEQAYRDAVVRECGRDVLERHHAIVRGSLGRYRGSEIDTAGDGFFATFDGPARAVRCAEHIVDAVHPLGIDIRAGVHTGECQTIDGKVGGLGVVIGARVGSTAHAGDILVSQTVKDLTAGSGLTFEDAGEHELKGVPDRWRLYRVVS
jgi:hypothetical protein